MKTDEIIEVMAIAMYEARFGNWRKNWKENWDDPDFDREDKAVTRFQAAEACAALTAKGLVIVPVEPTEAMLNAAIDVDSYRLGDISPLGFRISPQMLFDRCYRAMIAGEK